MARGGRRTPRDPAPVSGPGALARRTDGGPSDRDQPIRVARGGPYGSRQALEGLQAAAPLAAGGGVAAPPSPAASPAASSPAIDLAAPTPGRTIAQPPRQRRIVQDDPDALLRALYRVYPHPDIGRLLSGGV